MATVTDQTNSNLSTTLNELQLSETERMRIQSEKRTKSRMLEIQAVYDEKTALREEAMRVYTSNKLTVSTLIEESSFSRPTLYNDILLKRYAEYLIRKSNENDVIEKAQRAINDRQEIERYNDALVSDIIELLHIRDDYDKLVVQLDYHRKRIKELEDQLGIKHNVIPLEERIPPTPKKLDGIYPIDLHKD